MSAQGTLRETLIVLALFCAVAIWAFSRIRRTGSNSRFLRLLVALPFFFVVLDIGIQISGRQMTVYQMGMARLRSSPKAAEVLGASIEPGLMFELQLSETNDKGTAWMLIPVHGSKSQMSLLIQGEKWAGTWDITELALIHDDQKITLQ